MGGIYQVASSADSLWQTERQKGLVNWSVARIVEFASTSLTSFVNILGVSSLISRTSLLNGVQGPLPDNQWQKEVEHWFTAHLADLQRVPVEVATGPIDANFRKMLVNPQTPEQSVLCRSQVSSTFLSFPDS